MRYTANRVSFLPSPRALPYNNAFLEACICYFTDDVRRNNYMQAVTTFMNLPPDALAEEVVVLDETELQATLDAIRKVGVFENMASALN